MAGHSRSRSSSQAEATAAQMASMGNSLCLLDEELLCLGKTDVLAVEDCQVAFSVLGVLSNTKELKSMGN